MSTSAPIHQRAPRGGAGTVPSTPAPARASASGGSGKVRVDRSSQASSSALDLDANAYTSGDTIVMPQHHGPLDSGRGQELLAHELVHVNQQRRLGSSLPAEHTSAGQALEREAQSAESLVERHRSRAPSLDMPVARPQRSATNEAPNHSDDVRHATEVALAAGASDTGGGTIELTAGGTTTPDTPGPAPQRAARTSAPSRTAGSSEMRSVAEPGESNDEQELDELARKLYDRMRLRFKRELLLDRERGGVLADPR
jgi:hypothetical protein